MKKKKVLKEIDKVRKSYRDELDLYKATLKHADNEKIFDIQNLIYEDINILCRILDSLTDLYDIIDSKK